jgi:hypothetical protein
MATLGCPHNDNVWPSPALSSTNITDEGHRAACLLIEHADVCKSFTSTAQGEQHQKEYWSTTGIYRIRDRWLYARQRHTSDVVDGRGVEPINRPAIDAMYEYTLLGQTPGKKLEAGDQLKLVGISAGLHRLIPGGFV